MHTISIFNNSNHPQTFYIHGWNQNTTTVAAGQTKVFNAADGTSGAVIALHDGHEGEQAEITKSGWHGDDVIDISNEIGAGGNITVQQIGDPSTLKGDPLFMQHCNNAWHKASRQVQDRIRHAVTLDKAGNVIRIGPPKEDQPLMDFVRTFAEGKTYIGSGAWKGFKGDRGDNAQSSAAHGSKNIIIEYRDGYPVVRKTRETAFIPMKMTIADLVHQEMAKEEGAGVLLTNKSHKTQLYNFYENQANWNGGGVPNFTHPLKSVNVGAGVTTFISLPSTFKGRVQRGAVQPATWVEFQLRAQNDNAAWGNISLEMGYDGAAMIRATDGSNSSNGFVQDILKGAPAAAVVNNPQGQKVLDTTQGYWGGAGNKSASDYEFRVVGQKKAYILGGTGTDMVRSKNQRLAIDFY